MAARPIVAGTDGSEESLRAVDWAAREAVLRGAPLRIVAAAEAPPGMISRAAPGEQERVTDVLLGERDQALAAAAERAVKTAHGVLIDTDQLTGPVDEAVTDTGSGALMLVLGSRGRGAFTALLLGSVSRHVASHASCPVAIIRDEPPRPLGLVGVGVADLDSCGDALTFAFEEASLRQASLLALHAWHPAETEISRAGSAPAESGAEAAADAAGHLTGLLDDWRTKYPGVHVSQEVVHGHPGRALVGLSARADLVVIGRRASDSGRPGRGSVRHALLNHAHGPVVTVPSS
ncbi:MAG TPA: universal stress protein [Streptosporangiaceae bacterium]